MDNFQIIKIAGTCIKTNAPSELTLFQLTQIRRDIEMGIWCGSINNYWWIVPLEERTGISKFK